jgi:uncharacterized protein
MSLQETRPEGVLTVRWVRDDRIAVAARELTTSFLLSPDALHEDWPVAAVEQIDAATVAPLLALQPELVLIGTGPRQRLLTPRQQVELLRHGIGIEAMDNAAAARTYNLLALEGRRVVAGFVL